MKYLPEPYQESIRDHLLTHGVAYLSVGLGLGKTAATLSAINTLFQEGAIKAVLVVAPLRVARITWPNEAAKWDPFKWMKVEILKGQKPSGRAQLYLINYERLHQLKSLAPFDIVVFDETTKAKNHASKRIRAIRGLFKPHHQRWGMTGTPRPNSLLELFAQIRLLDDGVRLGRAYTGYRDAHFFPTDYMKYNWEPKPQAEEKIYRKIDDITLTLRSSDYLDLPDTLVTDIDVPLPPAARDAYDEIEKEFILATAKGVVVAPNAAVLAGKLHQICGGCVYNDQKGVEIVHGAKITALAGLLVQLKDVQKEQVLVACNYVHERERIMGQPGQRGIPGMVDASTFKGDIEKAWNSGRIKILVADPRSLGHGLNLQQGGRTVIWYSPTWSRELYDQMNARVARKGQTAQPMIYRLICPNTIDEAIVETLRERGDAQHAMLRVMANYRNLVI